MICFAVLFLALIRLNTIDEAENGQTISLGASFKNIGTTIDVNYTRIIGLVENFTSMGSRVTGYSGSYTAAKYIASAFKSYGLQVIVQNYTLAIPYDEGSRITIDSPIKRNITAYALWPNGVQTCPTPPEGITGRLIYAETGELGKIDGYDISGAIVLMDFNSGNNWIKVADLGAKAVVFIAPHETTLIQSLQKAISAPLYLPRLYVDSQYGSLLKDLASQNAIVTIHSKMRWKEITANNVVGIINGTPPYNNDVIVISASLDSWSIVPAVAPGAENALGISSLIEVARHMAFHKPSRTIWLVAFSGCYQGLSGPTEWVEQSVFAQEVQQGKIRILLHIHLDLSTRSNRVDVLFTGPPRWFGNLDEFARMFSPIEKKITDYLTSENKRDIVRFAFASMRWGTQPSVRDTVWLFNIATQPIISAGIYALTLRTQWSYRSTWLTPLNDERYIIWHNLKPQLSAIFTIIQGFANDPELILDYFGPSRLVIRAAAGRVPMGFVIVEGTTVEYDITLGWYSPKGEALVRLNLADANTYLAWPFSSQCRFSNSNGSFVFHGPIPWTTYDLDAWLFNDTDGSIIYAVDRGIYGTATGVAGGISTTLTPFSSVVGVAIPIFECTEIALFDLVDTRIMARSNIPWTVTTASLNVYDHATKSLPIFYGTYFSPSDGVGLIFVRKNSRVDITFNADLGTERRPRMVLTNSTTKNPEGFGFYVDKPLVVHNTAYVSARDLYLISENRYGKLAEHRVRNSAAEVIIQKAGVLVSRAQSHMNEKSFAKGFACALASLALSGTAYTQGVMPLFNEVSTFILLFTIPAIFFAVFFERLILHGDELKRIIGVAGILSITLFMFSLINPAFTLLENATMAILGVGLLILVGFIFTVVTNEAKDLMELAATSMLGMHIFKTERTAALLHSLSVATDNLRRRKLVTALTLLSVIIFTAAMTAFTSASYVLSVKESPASAQPPYNGILLKRRWGIPPVSLRGGTLDILVGDYLNALTDNDYYIAPRVWFYPISIYPEGISVYIDNPHGVTKPITPLVFLGLSKEEVVILFDEYTIEGVSSIALDNPNVCLLSKELSSSLNLTYGDHIFVKGTDLNLTVIGIIDIPIEELRDFDDRSIIPLDPFYSTLLSRMAIPFSEELPPQPLSLGSIIIVNWKTAYDLGGFVSSVALIPKGNVSLQNIKSLGTEIALHIDVPVYVGYEDRSLSLSKLFRISIIGWEVTWVLLAIVIISTVNVLISTIQRRRGEIFVYASVGLSPLGATLMFIVETLIYGAISSVIGYIVGYLLTMAIPEISFNVSSLYVIVSLFGIIGACTGSAIYPSFIAARLITPSLERRWRTSAKPIGDRWSIPVPLRITSKEESLGILSFLSEYYTGMGAQKRGFMVDGTPVLDTERLLVVQVTLTPVELSLTQEVTISMVFEKNVYLLNVLIRRKTGDPRMWESMNYDFIDDLRKQILLWRTLPTSERSKYIKISEK